MSPMVNFNAPWSLPVRAGYSGATGTTMNAVGEESFTVGQVWWKGGTSGATKVLSAAGGGRIYWLTASGIVWANVATNFELGIQDVTAGGLNDGTFDVSAVLVPGTETLVSNTLTDTLMESGSKTLSYGQLVAVGGTMTARGGVDVVSMDRVSIHSGALPSLASGSPYSVHLGAKNEACCGFLLKFDDGTYGWLFRAPLLFNSTISGITGTLFNQGSTPDEYIMAFTLDVAARILGASLGVTSVATTDTFDVRVYTDPFSSPALVETTSHPSDPDHHTGGNPGPMTVMLNTPYDLAAGAVLGFALRPTSANNIAVQFHDLTTGFDVLKNAQPFATIKLGSRTDLTGAFAETQAYHLPEFALHVGGFDTTSGGGGASFFPFGG